MQELLHPLKTTSGGGLGAGSVPKTGNRRRPELPLSTPIFDKSALARQLDRMQPCSTLAVENLLAATYYPRRDDVENSTSLAFGAGAVDPIICMPKTVVASFTLELIWPIS